jgi:hypothetical protein
MTAATWNLLFLSVTPLTFVLQSQVRLPPYLEEVRGFDAKEHKILGCAASMLPPLS